METVTLKTFFDALPGGFLITDTSSRVVYANEAVGKRSGFAVAEIVGKKPGELWGGRMDRDFYRSMWQTIGVKRHPFIGRVENKKKDGSLVQDTLHIAPLKDALGTPRYFVEVHPNVQSSIEEKEFGEQFVDRASHWHHDQGVWEWIVSLLAPQGAPRVTFPEENLIALVEKEFIVPTEKMFLRRFEDAPLIEAAKADPAAFAKLYEKYQLTIKGYFLRRIGEACLAEDLTQEVFARAFRYLPSFRVTNASYLTYLLHICHSLLVNYYRKEANTPRFLPLEEIDGGTDVLLEPIQESVESLLKTLTATEQEVMLLTYRDGFRAKEVGEKLGKTENAVKLILSRSRKKLRSV